MYTGEVGETWRFGRSTFLLLRRVPRSVAFVALCLDGPRAEQVLRVTVPDFVRGWERLA